MGKRNSAFELLRLISMFLIVFYHAYYYVIGHAGLSQTDKAVVAPFHIGVIVFVLISGYFNIRFSLGGLFKLLAKWFIYFTPLLLFFSLANENISLGGVIRPFVFISHTPYWFMRSYLFLFLLIPLIEFCVKNMGKRKRWYLLISLFFMTTYMGLVKGLPMEYEGKGVISFIFLYIIGDTLRYYEKWWKSISIWKILMCYVVLNTLIFLGIKYGDEKISGIVFYLSYPYGSPVIVLNAILLFILFGHITINSDMINWFAKSTLSIYLLHVHPVVLNIIFIPFMKLICKRPILTLLPR